MSLVSELEGELRIAALRHGRPDAAVLRINAKWIDPEFLPRYRGPEIVASKWGPGLTINLGGRLLSMPVKMGPPQQRTAEGEMDFWGVAKLGAHTWDLTPSLNQPGFLHAYIIVTDVPDPAPWEDG